MELVESIRTAHLLLHLMPVPEEVREALDSISQNIRNGMTQLPENQTDEDGNLVEEEKAFRRGFHHAVGATSLFVRFLLKHRRLEDSDLTVSDVLETFEEVAEDFRSDQKPRSWYSQQVQNEVAQRLGIDAITEDNHSNE